MLIQGLRDWLRLPHPGFRGMVIVPVVGAVLAAVAVAWSPDQVVVLNLGGIIPQSMNMLNILVGFYVGALGVFTAISAGPQIDRKLKVYNGYRIAGMPVRVRTLMLGTFGYLAFLALIVYVGGLVAIFVRGIVEDIATSTAARCALRASALAIYVFFFAHILYVTGFAVWLMSHYLPSWRDDAGGAEVEVDGDDEGGPGDAASIEAEDDER